MKKLFWLTVPILLLLVFFVFSKSKNQSETKPASVISQGEEITAVPPEESVTLSIVPTTIMQGEPAKITLDGLPSPSTVQIITLDDETVPIFVNEDGVAGLIGIDFHKKPGSYLLILTLIDGRTMQEKIEVVQRNVTTSEFDIPEQLGGNTTEAEHKLTDSLAKDTAIINGVIATTRPEKLWSGPFRLPLDGTITITDVYGYKRQTGSVNLSHQGTDFRASEGTPVYAINSGRVAFAGTLRNYGHTVIIDHGLGIMTAYMHLSEIKVAQEKMIEKGELIALSGNTGYSLGPHLHLSVRINGLTIDPMKFLELMGEK